MQARAQLGGYPQSNVPWGSQSSFSTRQSSFLNRAAHQQSFSGINVSTTNGIPIGFPFPSNSFMETDVGYGAGDELTSSEYSVARGRGTIKDSSRKSSRGRSARTRSQ